VLLGKRDLPAGVGAVWLVAASLLGASLTYGGEAAALPDAARLAEMSARFAPVEIGADVSTLPESERRVLVELIEASRILDGLYLRQVSAGNEALLLQLVADRSPLGQARLHYFLLNRGPWSRLDGDAPFLPGVGEKPPQANYYPPGAQKGEIEAWLDGLSGEAASAARGFFTTIRRDAAGALVAVPYSVEYQGELGLVADRLRAAAASTVQPTLREFLEKRAAALLSNDYYESDLAWMGLDASIEPTIGPYETYEDGWFGAKAAFESFITIRDEAETAKLRDFAGRLQELEDHLPIEARYRNPKLGALAPIRVVNVVFTGGEANSGVQTAAFNLPNDERVVREKGAKRVMLRNVTQAKFDTVLLPISKIALAPEDQARVSFDAFFTHILMHELMHGLGPQAIEVDGRKTTPRQELRETYGTLEEAKADISGLWALQYLVDHGHLDRSLVDGLYVTFLASSFRSIRFGLNEAHGRGIAIQLNSLLDAGAFVARPDGTFSVDPSKVVPAVEALTREILTIQAEGSYQKAQQLMERLVVVRPEVERVLLRLGDVPVDVEPRFTTAEKLLAE
jgi:hypothetical protein